MKRLWAPWRIEYIRSKKDEGCIFCDKPKMEDKNGLILFRGKTAFTLMNLYPYTNGHLMVAPLRHIDSFGELNKDERLEVLEQIDQSINAISKVMNPDGYNVGANLGESAGAGIKDHIHFHVVPRWKGDTNFMPVLGGTKVQVEGLENSWEKLNPIFNGRINA
ncbi:MAG: HIT domain-containing protein [Candidatus Marinimicrobia bacterium]|jgi:ATP adenylyltransferase|nr:HIT domain-containing protein [Candidatus Neomarinimicrobiota bacterium]|tara:strand:+ start:794 stop:1282 length:489 start_codon:yes stop_codon:yes gene_type:complete